MTRGYFRPIPSGTVDLGSSGEVQIGLSTYDNISILNSRTDVTTGGDVAPTAIGVEIQAQGTATVSDRVHGMYVELEDKAAVVNKTITGAVTNGGLIRITCTSHTFATDDHVAIYGVTGTTEANGAWVITVINANTFDLQGSTFTNAYVSGGTATNRPMMYGYFVRVIPAVSRGSLTGTAAAGDDIAGFVVNNISSVGAKATDAFYIGHNSTYFTSGNPSWTTGFNADANISLGVFNFGGQLTGSDANNCAIFNAGSATFSSDGFVMLAPNNAKFGARNAAGSANVNMFRLNSSNLFQIDAPTTMVTGSGTTNLQIQDITTNATNKVARVVVGHYTNAEEQIPIAILTSATSTTAMTVGGGSASYNACTSIAFHVAAANTTVTGTALLTIDGPSASLTVGDGKNFVFNTSTGTKFGTATTQKIGFWNVTPVVQPSAYTQTFTTADKTHAARTATALTDSSGGSADSTIALIPTLTDSPASADALRDDINTNLYPVLKNNFADLAAKVNALIVDLADTAGVVNSLVDDLQAVGIVA